MATRLALLLQLLFLPSTNLWTFLLFWSTNQLVTTLLTWDFCRATNQTRIISISLSIVASTLCVAFDLDNKKLQRTSCVVSIQAGRSKEDVSFNNTTSQRNTFSHRLNCPLNNRLYRLIFAAQVLLFFIIIISCLCPNAAAETVFLWSFCFSTFLLPLLQSSDLKGADLFIVCQPRPQRPLRTCTTKHLECPKFARQDFKWLFGCILLLNGSFLFFFFF